MAIISLVVGIICFLTSGVVSRALPLGIAFNLLGSPIIAVPLGIAGLILGILAVRRKLERGIAIAGIVLNSLVVLWFVAIITIWGIVGD